MKLKTKKTEHFFLPPDLVHMIDLEVEGIWAGGSSELCIPDLIAKPRHLLAQRLLEESLRPIV